MGSRRFRRASLCWRAWRIRGRAACRPRRADHPAARAGRGAAEARLFAQEGAQGAIADLLADDAAALAQEIGADRALALPLDVTEEV